MPLLFAAGTHAASGDPWSIVALPDTQKYAEQESLASFPKEQTQWIVDNKDAENIRFVSHEGDIVENADREVEWQRMNEAMSILDSEVPYSLVTGNHDYATLWDRSSSTALYEQYLGPSRFEGESWFGGRGPGDDGLSTYQLFSAGGYDFLHLALEWEPPGRVDDPSTTLGWAQDILNRYPDRPTILTTHSYLQDAPGERADFVQEADNNGNSGETVWRKLVAPNPQVFMILSGHFHDRTGSDNGEYHQTSTNNVGLDVYEMVANYQNYADGGDGWLRLLRFDPGGGSDDSDRIAVETYSPTRGEYRMDSSSEFGFDLDFDARFSSFDRYESTTFQQGASGYSGTIDTYVQEAEPTASNAPAATLNVDSADPQGTGQAVHALVRFDGLIGSGDSQVPLDATVASATVTLETTNDGDGSTVHRMLESWDDDDTWESLGEGVQADGTQAATDPVTTTGSVSEGPTTLDVTASVSAWLDGDPNHGWAFLPAGDDGWDFAASEGTAPPTLRVQYTASDDETVEGDADADGDVDADDVELVQRHIAGYDDPIDESAVDVDGDGDIDIADAVAIDNMRGDS
ncbi:DNRLRE domain-containing protein [Salinigranum halophilum]|uniref:DNRLRE domain-containing protein n=1 Tax=Salinigranum halophilum TaxID=2565931 RepID=UPI00191C62D8|nr:DNRLRE domain-containing protein [Salinigranum halophilum]